jgi:hypothetical protein
MQRIFVLIMMVLLSYSGASAQVSDSTSSLYVSVGQDSFFGFYAGIYGMHRINKTTSFTLYSNYWANPAYGNSATGTDFWTEVGAGVDFASANGAFHVNPALGFTYGKVLSGGEKGVLGDGIVPSVLTTFSIGKVQTQVSSIYFKALRTEGPVTTDYLWSWVNSVYSFSPAFRAGILVDHFFLMRTTGGTSQNLYLWIGPLIQINFPHDAVFKVSGGYDKVNKEYLKVNLSLTI